MEPKLSARRQRSFIPHISKEESEALDFFRYIKRVKECGYATEVTDSELEVRIERVKLVLEAQKAGRLRLVKRGSFSEEENLIISQSCESFGAWMTDLLMSSKPRPQDETVWPKAIRDIALRLRGKPDLDDEIIASLALIVKVRLG
jgi:hypothetical protein